MAEGINTKKNILWSGVERFSSQGIQFILGLIIARLLTPSEYGLIAMTAIFTSIAQVFIDSGFGNALIQKKDKNSKDFQTVFYFNTVVAIIVYLILYISAPLIADFYKQPILTQITRIIGICMIISSFSIVPRTILTVKFCFKQQAQITIISSLISGVSGIVCAYIGFGVWALVIQNLVNSVSISILYFTYSKWLPRLIFCWQSFKTLFLFGSKLLGSSLLHSVFMNLYSLVIGKFYSPYDVGLYNRGTSLAQCLPVAISSVMTRATYPEQCKNQSDDNWIRTSFLKYIKITSLITFPIMGLLIVLSKPLVLLILTEKWIGVVKILPILAMSYALNPIGILNNYVILAKGHSGSFFKAEIIKKIVAVIILILTVKMGLYILCVGLLIYNIFDLILISCFTNNLVGVKITSQLRILLPNAILTFISMLIAYMPLIYIENIYVQIICSSILFIIIFAGLGIHYRIISTEYLRNFYSQFNNN